VLLSRSGFWLVWIKLDLVTAVAVAGGTVVVAAVGVSVVMAMLGTWAMFGLFSGFVVVGIGGVVVD